jgi:putative oxidoreductase
MYFGAQKVFGAFGGPGIQNTIAFMHGKFQIPPIFAVLAMVAEFFGGLGILVGALTPVAAFGVACTMAVATFENWKSDDLLHALLTKPTQTQPPQAFLSLVLCVAALAIMLLGAGSFSVDAKLFKGKKVKSTASK